MTPDEKLDAILTDFEKRTATDPHHPGQNLRHLLDDSPDLKARFLDSVGQDHLKRFDLLPANSHAGGTYNPNTKSMELPKSYLDSSNSSQSARAELVFVMGHEIQHSFNSRVTVDATKEFTVETSKIARGSGPHDYTDAVNDLIQTNRRDEASANLGGFNALASQMQKDNPKATLKDFYEASHFRMQDFIDRTGMKPNYTYTLKPDLTLDKDKNGHTVMHLSASKENVEAMGKHYFDKTLKAPNGLGHNGNQNYHNYYGEWALNYINSTEKLVQSTYISDPKHIAPKVKINLRKIGLDPAQLNTPLHYTDTSPAKRKSIEPTPDESHSPAKRAKGPFGDPAVNKALQAMRSGNDTGVTQAAQQMKHSPEGQRLTQTAQNLLTEQQRQEPPTQTQAQPQTAERPLSR